MPVAEGDDETVESAADREARQISLIAPILEDTTGSTTDARRLAAAQELLAMNSPAAFDVLARSMRSGRPAQLLAILRAADGVQNPQFLKAAVDAVKIAPPETIDLLNQFLARHEVRVLQDVAAQASDKNLAPEMRLNAINVMGYFRTRDAAERLMNLLDDSRSEPDAITNATCDALRRLTRLSIGNDPPSWRAWWAKAKQQSREDWLVDQVQRLAVERAELERELVAQRQRSKRVEQRMVDVLKELFREIPNDIEKQLAPLPALLDDELTVVRLFAIDRVRFLSRDQEIPLALKDKLAAHLDDPESTVRTAAARLLHDLNYPGSSDLIAARLEKESSPETITAYLDILSARPSATAAPALATRLGDPQFCDGACSALWTIIDRLSVNAIDENLRQSIGEKAQDLAQSRDTPPAVRLACYFAPAEKLPEYTKYLDRQEQPMRIAVAEAFAARQHFEPLAARAADVSLYPILMRGLGGQPANVDTLKRILSFPFPDEPNRQHRRDAIGRVIGRLTPDQYIAADDAIVMSTVTPEFRLELLTRWLALPADQIPSPVRTELILRAARLQTALGQYPAAHHTLEMLNGVELTPELRQLRFTAAVKAEMYDRASEFESQPEQWIALLSTIAEDDEDAARALQAEIDRRFDGKITGELAATYEALRNRLAPKNENGGPPEAGSAQAPEQPGH